MSDPERSMTKERYLALPEQERMAARIRSLEAVLDGSARPARRINPNAGTTTPAAGMSRAESQAYAKGYRDAHEGKFVPPAPSEHLVQDAAKEADVTEDQARTVIRHFRQQ